LQRKLLRVLPNDLEVLVKVEGFVRCHDWDVFHEGLRDDLAIEWIGMVCREIEQPEGMLWRIR
jgi:hypothetical protein